MNRLLPLALAASLAFQAESAIAQQPPFPRQRPDPGVPQYEQVPEQPSVLWNAWLSDGPARVYSENSSLGNRFQIGVDASLLTQHRLILGITVFDLLSSGERSGEVGDISRNGFDLRAGYFFIPGKLWFEYGLYLGAVSGSNIYGYGYWGWWGQGWTGTVGHSLNLGFKFFEEGSVNLALEASYLFIGSQTIGTYNPTTNTTGQVTYPRANVYSLNLRLGFNVGG